MEPLWETSNFIDIEDIIAWRDDVGVRKGVIVDNGRVIFTEYPSPPHEPIIAEFNNQFCLQFIGLHHGTPQYPIFTNMGSTGICSCFKNEFDVLDIRIPGPGPNKQPDSAWRPRKRFSLNPALAALFPQQQNGDPFPTLVLEVGNSQPMSDLLKIRDRVLSSRTSVNLFALIAYNRNITRDADSWSMQISLRDHLAPPPPPGQQYAQNIVLFETPKRGSRYAKVQVPLGVPHQHYDIATTHLYYPEPVPNLLPPLPAYFRVDVEAIRACIMENRRP
jgi:hypothetical protein